MVKILETEIYLPIKTYLEAQGYEVKSEIADADVMGVKTEGPPILVELKVGFSLTLLQQAVARQAVSDQVYVAVPRWVGRAGWKAFKANVGLCRRLELGVLSVDIKSGAVQVHAEPKPFQKRKSKLKQSRLSSEFNRREGDPNLGGTRGKIQTAYRQDAEKCAAFLAESGSSKGSVVRDATGVARATVMMRDNHYGWFTPSGGGVYALTDAGFAAVSAKAVSS